MDLSSTSLLPQIRDGSQRQHFRGCSEVHFPTPLFSPLSVFSCAFCSQMEHTCHWDRTERPYSHIPTGSAHHCYLALYLTSPAKLWLSEAGTKAPTSFHPTLSPAQCQALNQDILIKAYLFICISPLPLWMLGLWDKKDTSCCCSEGPGL